MQLDRKKTPNIRDSLAVATCSLLAGIAPQAQAESFHSPWQIDSGLLFYSEKDRVSLVEPVLQIRKEIDDNEFFTVRLVADTLTGASPNGAAPTDAPQTFTSPSGDKSYTAEADKIPLDTTFKDTRGAVNLTWDKPLSNDLRGVFGANFSTEHDYTSFGASASLSKDFNQRNTTLTGAASLSLDSISPVGGTPIPLADMSMVVASSGDDDDGEDESSESKTVQEYLLGVSQVISRTTLTQLNYSYGHSSGYLTDPYKVLSVLANDGSGDLRVPGDPSSYIYEKRPDSRTFQSIYWKGIHQFSNEDVLTLAYRYGWDDWGINSDTYDVRYRWELGHKHYLQPHYRHYTQSAADFYRQTLLDSELPGIKYVSADSRLGELTTETVGLKYGYTFAEDAEINLRVEYMHQTGKTRSQDAVGKLQNYDLFPENKASIIQLGLSMSTDSLSRILHTALLKITK